MNLLLKRLLVTLGLAIGTGLLVVLTSALSTEQSFVRSLESGVRTSEFILSTQQTNELPTPQPHPLPPTLAQWQDATNSGDYFSQVKPTEVGYLVWSQFPVRVYVEQPKAVGGTQQVQRWVSDVLQAVQEWNVYLPLTVVEQPELADITIVRSALPLRSNSNSAFRSTATNKLPRVRSAETRYELYISKGANAPNESGVQSPESGVQSPESGVRSLESGVRSPESGVRRLNDDGLAIFSHRCTIRLSPSQTGQYTQAAARHELGHALGIWGHSPVATDVLYFSQVRNPPPISPRDLNTLKRVYEQPTQLGWSLVSSH